MRQALYRRYRPKTFDEVFGQDHIIPILKNQIKTNSVSHAYLFSGPRGTGKTSTAKLFAAALNKGSDIDVIELDAASNNRVEDIREIVDTAALAPFGGAYKVYILDEAHMLSKNAANALLKTLEEPPQHVIFILATTEPDRIPKTILSRTLRFDFAKITPEVILERLKEVLAREEISYTDTALLYIAQKSNGGLRDALSLLDKALSYGELNEENVITALGAIDSAHQYQLLQALAHNDLTASIDLLHAIESAGIEPRIFIQDMIEYLRDIILFKNGLPLLSAHLEEGAQLVSDQLAAYLIEEFSATMNLMRSSAKPEIQMFASMVTLCTMDFNQIDVYRNIPAKIKEALAGQKHEILQLKEELFALRQELASRPTYPQNPVDKPDISVDNSLKLANLAQNTAPELSTSPASPAQTVAKIQALPQAAISDEELAAIKEIKAHFPELKQQLKNLRRVHISSMMELAEAKRFIGGNLFFVYEGQNKGMCKAMIKTDPNQYIDPILSKLMDRPIATHYITEDDLHGIKEEDFDDLVNKISQSFPDVNLQIKE